MPRSALDRIKVASPCQVSWDEMEGDERVRHCSYCDKNVFNLSAMRQSDAEKLVLAANRGRIQMGLRNTLDLDTTTTEGMRISGLLPSAPRARRTVPTTRRSTSGIEIYRGNNLTTETVEGGS